MSNPVPANQKRESPFRVLFFVAALSVISALILSVLASGLKTPQEEAKELDRSKQMMIAAKLMTHEGNFLILSEKGEYEFAKVSKEGVLVPGRENDFASSREILEIYKKKIVPFLVDNQGNSLTFEKAGINEEKYLAQYRKTGYYREPFKLLYKILPDKANSSKEENPVGYVIPVNGFGLWDAIYGYLAVQPDGNTVIGISWYDQKETPGLGANIAEGSWQAQFFGKKIFQANIEGTIDYKKAPIGISVLKGRVSDLLKGSPKALSSVDGMPGATLTGNGVTTAYRDVLNAYRPFFIKLHENGLNPKEKDVSVS